MKAHSFDRSVRERERERERDRERVCVCVVRNTNINPHRAASRKEKLIRPLKWVCECTWDIHVDLLQLLYNIYWTVITNSSFRSSFVFILILCVCVCGVCCVYIYIIDVIPYVCVCVWCVYIYICYPLCVCVCVCVCGFMWFMRTQICIITWVDRGITFEGGLWGHCLCPCNSKGLKTY